MEYRAPSVASLFAVAAIKKAHITWQCEEKREMGMAIILDQRALMRPEQLVIAGTVSCVMIRLAKFFVLQYVSTRL